MKTHNSKLVNVDTDSIMFTKQDGSPFTEEEQDQLIAEINGNFPEHIRWAHDGLYERVIVLKAKNYILYEDGKAKIKGSALRSSKTEKALKEMMIEVIDHLYRDDIQGIRDVYHKYIKEAFNVEDISRWTAKKTITEKVLKAEREQELKVLRAIEGKSLQMGDKIYVFFDKDENLVLQENWVNNHNPIVLIRKIYNTMKIFKNVIDMDRFQKYHLKNHDVQVALHHLLGLPPPEKVKKTKKVDKDKQVVENTV